MCKLTRLLLRLSFQTSAKDPPLNVDAAFHELVRIVRSQMVDEKKPTKSKKSRGKKGKKCEIL